VRSSVGDNAKISRTVSLNVRMLANPAAQGQFGHGERGRLDQHPRGLRALRPGEGERTCAELGKKLPLDLPSAVPQPGGEAGNSVARDDPVGDEPHRPVDQVSALIPLRGARADVRPAAFARPESGLLRRRRRARVKAHVDDLGRHRRTAGPTVDPGGEHRGVEPAVEPGVLGLDGSDTALEVFMHQPSIVAATGAGRAKIRHHPAFTLRLTTMSQICQPRPAGVAILDCSAFGASNAPNATFSQFHIGKPAVPCQGRTKR
jgi:hypothetical protein